MDNRRLLSRPSQLRDFGAKLRLTAMLFGCDNQKALDALFREADPNTDFDIARSYKWMQGRAAPRSAKLYEEWARLLDAGRSSEWLATCELDAFVAALEARHGAAAATLRTAIASSPDNAAPSAQDGFLPGRFAVYSLAQSPYYEGRFIRSDLTLGPSNLAEPGHPARLGETFAGVRAVWSGLIEESAQGLSGELRNESGTLSPSYLALVRPTLPGSLLAGLQTGFVSLQPGAQRPFATRIAALRVPDLAGDRLAESNRYLEDETGIAADLGALGLPIGEAPGFAEDLGRWLRQADDRDGPNRVSGIASLVEIADRLWLRTL